MWHSVSAVTSWLYGTQRRMSAMSTRELNETNRGQSFSRPNVTGAKAGAVGTEVDVDVEVEGYERERKGEMRAEGHDAQLGSGMECGLTSCGRSEAGSWRALWLRRGAGDGGAWRAAVLLRYHVLVHGRLGPAPVCGCC